MPVQTRSMLKGLIAPAPEQEKPEQIITQSGVILLSQNEVDELGINCELDSLIPQYRRCLPIHSDFGRLEVLYSPANNINTYADVRKCGKEYALAPEGFYWKHVNPTSYYSDMDYWELERIPKTKDKTRNNLPNFHNQLTCRHQSLRFWMSRMPEKHYKPNHFKCKCHYEKHYICGDCYYQHVEIVEKNKMTN